MIVAEVDGIEEWGDLCSRHFIPLEASGPRSFHGRVRSIELDSMRVSLVESDPAHVVRSSRLAKVEPRGELVLNIQTAGQGIVEKGGQRHLMTVGGASLTESDRPYSLLYRSSVSLLTLQFPRSLLPKLWLAKELHEVMIAPRAPGLVILRNFLTGLIEAEPETTSSQTALSEMTLELLQMSLSPLSNLSANPRSSQEAMWIRVQRFVMRHIDDPRLTPSFVASHNGLSRRRLELLFAEHGSTPAARIRQLRLHRACLALADRTRVRTVSEVAYSVGFGDVTTFIRGFRKEFGVTPDQWRRRGAALWHAEL